MKYEHIFKPIKIGPLTLRNRIEVAPHEPKLATWDGLMTNEFVTYTAAMARGGAALVTIGDSAVTQEYANTAPFALNLAHRYASNGLFKLADAIHRYGAIASIEPNYRNELRPAEMTKEDIRQMIKAFADCAVKCKNAGFDMIMIHGGHGHNLSQFFSPLMNKRTDEYGCDTFENRNRLANNVLDAVRQAIGNDMAIEWRHSGDDLTPGGVGVEDQLAQAKAIQNKIDLIHVSAGNLYYAPSVKYMIQQPYVPMTTNIRFAERFKKELDIPVVSVGSFNLDLAEEAIAAGKCDMVAMIRQFIADPDCVNKARDGRGDEIRPCIRCCVCVSRDPHGNPMPVRCSVNPVSGRDPFLDDIKNSDPPKKVVVVGGGCAGMEAARRLAERGNSVVLFEKAPELGGSLIEAYANRLKSDIKRYTDWSIHMTKKTPGIDIRLNTPATRELVLKEKPDAVIVAVGSEQIIPDIPGIRGDNVCLAVDVDMGKAKVGKKVVVIGAGLTGTETAVVLAQDGHDVTQIDMLSIEQIDSRTLGSKSVANTLRGMAAQAGVKTRTGLKAVEVTKQGVTVQDDKGFEFIIPCDTVVLSVGVRPRTKVMEEFRDVVRDVYFVGDCSKPGNITSAVREGFYAAINI